MNEEKVLLQTAQMIQSKFGDDASGHDWWHIWRVWQLTKRIAQEEKANTFIAELGALLHDIADWKTTGGDLKAGGVAAREWLVSIGVDPSIVDKVSEIVDHVSFKGAGVVDNMNSLEGRIVQDSDRLDAMGAMGIARVFAYGGHMGRSMHNPAKKVALAKNFNAYEKSGQTAINHFYEKLLLLKDRMHTTTGKRLAEGRHKYMEKYLEQFYAEWEGKR
jgi:uncharacterized protein